MTVSSAAGGAAGSAALVGGFTGGGGSLTLPFTGASRLELLLWMGTLFVLSGVMLVGLTRRHAPRTAVPRGGPR